MSTVLFCPEKNPPFETKYVGVSNDMNLLLQFPALVKREIKKDQKNTKMVTETVPFRDVPPHVIITNLKQPNRKARVIYLDDT